MVADARRSRPSAAIDKLIEEEWFQESDEERASQERERIADELAYAAIQVRARSTSVEPRHSGTDAAMLINIDASLVVRGSCLVMTSVPAQ